MLTLTVFHIRYFSSKLDQSINHHDQVFNHGMCADTQYVYLFLLFV